MLRRHRIHLCWGPRREPALAACLHAYLGALGQLDPSLAGWRAEDDGADHPLATESDCAAAVARGAVEWQLGASKRTAHQLHAFVGRPSAPTATLVLVGGIEPLEMGDVFTPNRLDLRFPDTADTPLVQHALATAADVFAAAFGHAGSERTPEPPLPLYSRGVPAVGWMTYLSRAYPQLPPLLPAPAVAYATAGGSLVVAHPKPFRAHVSEHRRAVADVEAALRRAGVLVPFAAVSPAIDAGAPPRAARSADRARDHA
jgi:immunity protein 52 of polymorphic toxin system